MTAEELRHIDRNNVFTYVRVYHDVDPAIEGMFHLMLNEQAARRRRREEKRRAKEAKAEAKGDG